MLSLKKPRAKHAKGWRLELGARPSPDGTAFRVWSPKSSRVDVALESGKLTLVPMIPEREGYFSCFIKGVSPGALYTYRLDGRARYPDPCSRFQPHGPLRPSMVIDPHAYSWHDSDWKGLKLPGQIFYELHVGVFTEEGSFAAARGQLRELKALGITAVELLPVNEFPGRWNWGYDGVDIYAPSHHYGSPREFKEFVDAAHSLGLGIVLDVVYNHMGPSGCFLQEFSDYYFSDRMKTEWGRAINFDGAGSNGVREFFVQNACYWISEFHLDGLRVDATQNIYDAGWPHVLAELTTSCRKAAGGRDIMMIAENEPQDTRCLAPVSVGGFGFDAMWNDDFHHAVWVGATKFREAYLQDYRGSPQEFISTVKRGFLFQGQYFRWQGKNRGSRVREEPAPAFIQYLQNHDQIGNNLEGSRVCDLIGGRLYRALMTFMMLSPGTPLLFMGQEFACSSRFPFFADIPGLEKEIYKGRKTFITQFPTFALPSNIKRFPDPCREATFKSAVLNLSERCSHAPMYLFHKALIALRKEDPVIAMQSRECCEGAVLAPEALALRYSGGVRGDRLLLLNYGTGSVRPPFPEPLLAAEADSGWRLVFSSDGPQFGGQGAFRRFDAGNLRIPGQIGLFFEQRRGEGG